MDTEQLSTFLKVIDCGSFSEAANRLHISQPAVSKRIQSLEAQLKVVLFDRIGQQIKLTQAGEILVGHAQSMLFSLENCRKDLQNLNKEITGSFELATSHHVALHRLASPLKSYCQHYPNVSIHFSFQDSEEAYQSVISAEVDLAVVTLSPEPVTHVKTTPIWSDPLLPVIARQHPLSKEKSISIQQVMDFPAILPEAGTFTRQIIEKRLSANTLSLSQVKAINYLETIRMLVEIGMGWSVLPENLISDQLIVLDVPELEITRELGLIVHESRTLSHAAKAFYELVQQIRLKHPLPCQ